MEKRHDIIQKNIKNIQKRIAAAADRSGREAKNIQLVAVTKNIAIEDICTAIQSGIKIIGENKIQEAKKKFLQIGPTVAWHLLGHLQTNKAKIAASLFDMIQSVDSARIADALESETHKRDRQMDVLLEVNVSNEEGRFGVSLSEAEKLAEHIVKKKNLRLRGLMAMAPFVDDVELARPFFRQMSELYQRLTKKLSWASWNILSIGMTNDFEVAIEEGSNLVRIGTGIFHTPELRDAT